MMILTEVLDDLQNMSIGQYLTTIAKKNNMNMASGSFGISLIPESGDKVYKLWMVDAAYEKWISYCLTQQSNKVIPKIYSKRIRRVTNIFMRDKRHHNKINYIVMEKLYKIDLDSKVVLRNRNTITYSDVFKNLNTLTKLEFADDGLQNQYDSLFAVAIELSKDNELDLATPNNIMKRKNGEFVFTDPIVDFRNESVYTKLPSALEPELNNAVSGRNATDVTITIPVLLTKSRQEQLTYFIKLLQQNKTIGNDYLDKLYETSPFSFIQYLIACGTTDKTKHTNYILHQYVPTILEKALAKGKDIYFKLLTIIDNKFSDIYHNDNNILNYCGIYANLDKLSTDEMGVHIQYLIKRSMTNNLLSIYHSNHRKFIEHSVLLELTNYFENSGVEL